MEVLAFEGKLFVVELLDVGPICNREFDGFR
jgi:hypothetical protein